ncbi:hypothetical protein MKQ68_05030 [Chitinophaga horti]|uniref:Aspartyl protease n=1 Tax=Chitinophaga horti TaxID=2920382 RepID=A0ABY6J4A0_9BACT|nr:hypothetical protein [Chitinophaga horti]UYQ94452.1 hypothetical protein MKQ68_05030 [Chitinophaga horti]
MRQLLLLSLVVIFQLPAYAQPTAKNEIPFQLLPSGHLLVSASVAGVEGKFIFDTGAGLTVFVKTYFDKLPDVIKEDGGYTGFRATGERLDIDLYKVRDFHFGPIRKAVEEISYLDANLGGIDGIISLKALESGPFTIDYTKKVLRIESPAALAGIRKTAKVIPVQLEQSRDKSLTLFSYFKVNDTLNLQLSLDSGAGKDVFRLSSRFTSALGVNVNDTTRVRKIEKRSEIDQNHISHIYVTKLDKLASTNAPSVDTRNFPVQFVEGLIYDGIIWINWLGQSVTFDLQNKVLLVKR